MLIRPYRPEADESACFDLWHNTLGHSWRIDREVFHQATCQHGGADSHVNLVADVDGQIAGFICSQQGDEDQAGLLCTLVAPHVQARGMGRQLVKCCLDALADRGVKHVSVGHGGHAYFCPGVPVELPIAKAFCESLGWHFDEVMFDMTMKLNLFSFDPAWLQRPASNGFHIHVIQRSQIDSLLAFEERNFPEWLSTFEAQVKLDTLANIIVAVDKSGHVAGALTLFSEDEPYDNGIRWRALIGRPLGGFGVLGVREDARGQGIGLGLAAEATRLLRERGVGVSFVGWTYLQSLYGRLGYQVWRKYYMSDALALT